MGGSQGAKIINESILHILPKSAEKFRSYPSDRESDYENVIQEAGRSLA